MKLSPKTSGKNPTAYRITVGSAEARRLGFITPDGERVELEKIIDEENKQLIIRIAQCDK